MNIKPLLSLCMVLTLIVGCNISGNSKKTTNKIKASELDSLKDEVKLTTISSRLIKSPTSLATENLPEGYEIGNTYAGDLNKDGINDSIIEVCDFRKEIDNNRCGLMIFFAKENQWELISQNLECFELEFEMGGYPPERFIEIEDGKLYIHYLHGRYGFWKYTFRHNESDFQLIGFDIQESSGPVIDREISINYLTKKMLIRENINELAESDGDEKFSEHWLPINLKQPITFSNIESLEEKDNHYQDEGYYIN